MFFCPLPWLARFTFGFGLAADCVERVQKGIERGVDRKNQDRSPRVHVVGEFYGSCLGQNSHYNDRHPATEVGGYNQRHLDRHSDFTVPVCSHSDSVGCPLDADENGDVAKQDNQERNQIDTKEEND